MLKHILLRLIRFCHIICHTKSENGTTVIRNAVFCGERGIRTPGTVIPYVSLANWWFQPLTHLTKTVHFTEWDCKYIKILVIRKIKL